MYKIDNVKTQADFLIKVEHVSAMRCINHVYGYKFRPREIYRSCSFILSIFSNNFKKIQPKLNL